MAKIDLTELSDVKEKIVKIDEKTAKRYKVVEEAVDLEALKQEKANLEEQLNMPEPTKEELIELGKMYHPYYTLDREAIRARISQIEEFLNSVS